MRRHLPESIALVAAVGAAVAGLLAAVVGARAAVAVLSFSVALGMVSLAWALRRLLLLGYLPQVDTVTRETRKLARQTRRRVDRTVPKAVARRRHQAVRERLGRIEHDARRAGERVDRTTAQLRSSLEQVAGDAVRLARLVDDLAPGSLPLPVVGGWAVTAGTLLELTDEVARRSGPVTVLECGSGTSTLLLALQLRRRGQGGRVVALESDPHFAEETRGHLRTHGVDDLATVVIAPVGPVDLPDGTTSPWYDLTDLPELGPVDVLFVDGPWGRTAPHARYPALPLLGHRLAPGALVVLDDTSRIEEKEIVERWVADGTPALAVERKNAWSTMLRVG